MQNSILISVLIVWLTASSAVLADETSVVARILQQDQGRSYGVMVGDMIHHRFVVEVKPPYSIIQSSLPQSGELNYWLELRDVAVSTKESDDRTLYLIDLKYQTFYAPLDVRTLTIPGITLDFSAGEQRFQLHLPDWQFTMSPIKEITPGGVGNNNNAAAFMKAAIAPKTFSLDELNQRLGLLAAATSMVVIALLWLNGLLPKLGQSPFIGAARQIRRIKRRRHTAREDYLACLQSVHQAINQRAQTTVFAGQLDDFLAQFPQFSSLRDELTMFFRQSRDAFFMDKQPDPILINDCLDLCREMAAADKVTAVK